MSSIKSTQQKITKEGIAEQVEAFNKAHRALQADGELSQYGYGVVTACGAAAGRAAELASEGPNGLSKHEVRAALDKAQSFGMFLLGMIDEGKGEASGLRGYYQREASGTIIASLAHDETCEHCIAEQAAAAV